MARTHAEGPFVVDLDAFPLVRLWSPSESAYEQVDVASFFACAELAVARGAAFVLLHDARGMPYVDEPRQSHFLLELARWRPLIVRRVVAYAAIVSSPLERGLITALGWAAKLPFPTKMFATEFEARSFLLERYQRVSPGAALPRLTPELA